MGKKRSRTTKAVDPAARQGVGFSGLGSALSIAPTMRAAAAGVAVTPDTAMRVTTVLRCINLISQAEASLPLVLYREERRGERFPAETHPLYRILLRRPNNWQTPFEFKRLLMVWLLQRGNAYAFVQRDGFGQVKQLIPVHPNLVTVLRAWDGTPVYDFSIWPGAPRLRVTNENMIHLRWMTLDGYTGLSPIALAAESIGVSIAAEDYGARFFGGGAQPNGVLTLPGKLSEDAQRRVGAQWAATYNGLSNSHKTVVLSDGAKYERIGIPPDEAQFLELRGFQVEDIARIYGPPPHMVGHTSKTTSWGSGIGEQALGFLKFVLRPLYLTGVEEELNRALLLDSEDEEFFIRHDTAELERGNMAAIAEWARKLLDGGVVNPNEVRARFDMNPYPGGERFRVPSNTFAQDSAQAAGAVQDEGGGTEPTMDNFDGEDRDEHAA